MVISIPTFEEINVKVDYTKPIPKQNNYEDIDVLPRVLWIDDLLQTE
jgi:hypothetical protein